MLTQLFVLCAMATQYRQLVPMLPWQTTCWGAPGGRRLRCAATHPPRRKSRGGMPDDYPGLNGYCGMSEQPRRVNYSAGMILTASDFQAEQEYHRQMRYLHNRLLHGYGTVAGLDVVVDGRNVLVSPGLAIDAQGREIIVTEQMSLSLDPPDRDRRRIRDVAIAWREVPEDPAPSPDGTESFSRWIEEPELSLVLPDSDTSERVVLARLTWKGRHREIDIDVTVRRPLGLATSVPRRV